VIWVSNRGFPTRAPARASPFCGILGVFSPRKEKIPSVETEGARCAARGQVPGDLVYDARFQAVVFSFTTFPPLPNTAARHQSTSFRRPPAPLSLTPRPGSALKFVGLLTRLWLPVGYRPRFPILFLLRARLFLDNVVSDANARENLGRNFGDLTDPTFFSQIGKGV